MGAHEGSPGAIAFYRVTLMPKIWFFFYNCGAVFFLPYVNLFYRKLGFTEQQIGVLCALKPWVSAPAGNLVVSLADKWQAHVFVCLATYLICLFGRGLIALVAGYGLQLFLALLTESAAAPLGVVIDAAVMASATDEGGYGRQRMWASIGWGGMSPVAGVVVARYGLQAAFGVYFLVVALAFVPTCLLPISILSSGKPAAGTGTATGAGVSPEGSEAKLGGAGTTTGPQGGGRGGRDGRGGIRGSSSGGEIEVGSRSGSAARLLALPEKRARMDSDLASRAGSKHNLLAAAGTPPAEPTEQWTLASHAGPNPSLPTPATQPAQQGQQGQQKAAGQPYGVVHLTADARRTPTEQLLEMTDGTACAVHAAPGYPAPEVPRSVSKQPAGPASGAADPLLTSKEALSDDADSCTAPAPALGAGQGEGAAHGSVWQGVRRLLGDAKVVTFFFLAFCMGIGNGCIGFLFLYLDELGAPGTLLGLCLSFNCMAEVPVFYYSGPLIEWLGVERAFTLAMAGYVLRVACYIALPLLPSVWWVLPVELLQGLTFALAWSSGCVYVKRIAPVWLRSTVQSIFQGLYAGIGSGLGGLVGGFLYGVFGAGVLFKSAAVTLVVGLVAAQLGPRLAHMQEARQHSGYERIVVGEVEGDASGEDS